MSYATNHIATTLKNARKTKGLTQRALSHFSGVPQSHISKIESGAVDLRLTSLIELARALDLELALVPRKSLPAVNSIVRSTTRKPPRIGEHTAAIRKELNRLQTPLDKLLKAYPTHPDVAKFRRALQDLKNLRFISVDATELRDARRAVDRVLEHQDPDGLRSALLGLRNLRDAAAHSAASPPENPVRPAYALDPDDHDR